MPTIETQRLFLRMFTQDDVEDLYRLFSDPDVMRYVGKGELIPRQETEAALLSVINHWTRHGFGRWVIIDKETQGFIGYGGLRMLIDTPEVVYHLAKAYWGLGLATEVARASLRFGFRVRGFERIVAIARPENHASTHVMEKIGMRYEKHTEYYNIGVVQYSILSENYEPIDTFFKVHDIATSRPDADPFERVSR